MEILEQIPDDLGNIKRKFAVDVVRHLREHGHEALLAGGCVRDMLLGIEPSDFDVATSAHPDEVRKIFRRSLAVGASFGVIVVQGTPESGDIEVATFRSDGDYLDGRRPDSVRFSDAREDANRRDFTINGLYYDPIKREVIDYVGGREDLRGGMLRAIGEPEKRFSEDKLRLIRAIRFAARFNLEIEPRTFAAIKQMASDIHVVSVERIAQELRKMLPAQARVLSMELLRETGILAEILPEAILTIGLVQNKPAQPGGDLWDHTLKVMEYLPGKPSFPLAFAALLHDLGKPVCAQQENGRWKYYGHEVYGREIAEVICRRLKLSVAETQRITWLVENHQYLGSATKLKESRIKRIMAMPGIEELLDLHEADARATHGDTSEIDYCRYYLKEQPQGPINPPLLFTGHDLARLGVKPGPIFKTVLERIREAQLDRLIGSKKEATELAIRECQVAGMDASQLRID